MPGIHAALLHRPRSRRTAVNPAAAPMTIPVQRMQTGICDPFRTKLRSIS